MSVLSTIAVRQTTTTPCGCKICGASSRYSYYGAIVCQPCKMFFRRNTGNKETKLKCEFGDKCEININNRRICPSCRLAKCFASGMQMDMIRPSWAKTNETSRKRKLMADSTSTSLVRTARKQKSEQIPTLNLLQTDRSILSNNQWNLLSNLVHSFDEYSGYSFVESFIQDQNALPLKLRFKYSSVSCFFTSMMTKVQLVFEKNRDFLLLSFHDRSILLRNTAEYTSSIGGMFLMRQAHLFDHPSFYNSAEIIFRPSAVACTRRVIDQLDSDNTFIKLVFVILAFSTMNYTIYSKSATVDLINIKAILPIQDMYTELVWRYLLHKYDHYEAVMRFSNLIRCLLQVNNAIVEAHQSRQFNEMIDSVVEQTERKLIQQSNGFFSYL